VFGKKEHDVICRRVEALLGLQCGDTWRAVRNFMLTQREIVTSGAQHMRVIAFYGKKIVCD